MVSIIVILFVIIMGIGLRAGSENIILFVILTASILAIGGLLPFSLIAILIFIMAYMILNMFYDMFVVKR